MSSIRPNRDERSVSEFDRGRVVAEEQESRDRGRAARTVARHSLDQDDHAELLAMLGLAEEPDGSSALLRSLTRYVDHVAAEVGVPPEAVGCEVSDTATAYLGLSARCTEFPSGDLMLVWDERLGWYVGIEPRAGERVMVLSYLAGDAVPTPAAVARFVTAVAAGRRGERLRPVAASSRAVVATRMDARCARHATPLADLPGR